MSGAWTVEHERGTATELHDLVAPDDGARRIWVLEPSGPAVVLGSTQPDDLVDRAAAAAEGVEVARRRSGGGAVWVSPDDPVWIDVLVPRDDPLWDDDVAAAFLPIGRAWARALAAAVPALGAATIHEGPMVRTEWSRTVCFAGIGPGEVLIGGRKVVGISQRRTRAGARFQCALPRVWEPERLRRLLAPPIPAGALDHAAGGIGTVPVSELVRAVVEALTSHTHS